MSRFIGNLDLCGRQIQKPCRTSLGFPVVIPHDAVSDEASGKSYPWIGFKIPSNMTKTNYIHN